MKQSRIRPKNPERAAKARAEDFGAQAILCRLLPCFACGAGPPSDPDHHPTRGAGGHDPNTAPLCRTCHNLRGSMGVVSFQRRFLIDLELATRVLATIVRRAFREGDGWDAGTVAGRWKTPPGSVIDRAAYALDALRGGGSL